jgi:hypothetical protein
MALCCLNEATTSWVGLRWSLPTFSFISPSTPDSVPVKRNPCSTGNGPIDLHLCNTTDTSGGLYPFFSPSPPETPVWLDSLRNSSLKESSQVSSFHPHPKICQVSFLCSSYSILVKAYNTIYHLDCLPILSRRSLKARTTFFLSVFLLH